MKKILQSKESFSGYTNQETLATALWLNNDENLHKICYTKSESFIKHFVLNLEKKEGHEMFNEVIDTCLIDWTQIADSLVA